MRRSPRVPFSPTNSSPSLRALQFYLRQPRRHTRLQSFTTTTYTRAIAQTDDTKKEVTSNARLVPASPSYFTAQPGFTDDLLTLEGLCRRYETLPVVPPGQAPRVTWKKLMQYRMQVGENVRAAKYHKIVQLLRRLNQIHPSLMPADVREAIEMYKRPFDPSNNRPKPKKIDKYGRSTGTGRRKASSARVWLVEGEGEVLINGKSLVATFPRVHDRESAVWALKATQRLDKYNVWAIVNGGGTTGQAEALTLGVARALLVHEPMLKPALRRAGCVTRDPRRVERKKPGKLKARKMPAWVKR